MPDHLNNENKWLFRGAAQHHFFPGNSKNPEPSSDQLNDNPVIEKIPNSPGRKKLFTSFKKLVVGMTIFHQKHGSSKVNTDALDDVSTSKTVENPSSEGDDDAIRKQIAYEEKDKQVAK